MPFAVFCFSLFMQQRLCDWWVSGENIWFQGTGFMLSCSWRCHPQSRGAAVTIGWQKVMILFCCKGICMCVCVCARARLDVYVHAHKCACSVLKRKGERHNFVYKFHSQHSRQCSHHKSHHNTDNLIFKLIILHIET